MKLFVALNGTTENPWHKLGLTQNPFPQNGKAETSAFELHLQALGGDPIPNEAYIRDHLAGWHPEFVDLCCQKFRPCTYVQFDVVFGDAVFGG